MNFHSSNAIVSDETFLLYFDAKSDFCIVTLVVCCHCTLMHFEALLSYCSVLPYSVEFLPFFPGQYFR